MQSMAQFQIDHCQSIINHTKITALQQKHKKKKKINRSDYQKQISCNHTK
ncbi:hypothetical protein Hanom_Chr06g00492141 [Helianthus anomalus]